MGFDEVRRAVDAGAKIIGLDGSGNLHTLQVEPSTFARWPHRSRTASSGSPSPGARGPHDVIELAQPVPCGAGWRGFGDRTGSGQAVTTWPPPGPTRPCTEIRQLD